MTREQKYTEQMKELGIYNPAFDPEIHTLGIMEREHQRTLKAWAAEGSKTDADIYAVIVQQRRDILAHRDALGLTPKALRRLRSTIPSQTSAGTPTVLELIQRRHQQEA